MTSGSILKIIARLNQDMAVDLTFELSALKRKQIASLLEVGFCYFLFRSVSTTTAIKSLFPFLNATFAQKLGENGMILNFTILHKQTSS